MDFTYNAYNSLLDRLKVCGYEFATYYNWTDKEHPVTLRHDIDYDIKKSVELAHLEQKKGVTSTYFVLLTSDFYNVFSKGSADNLKQIIDMGHTVGLHFDEARYPDVQGDLEAIRDKILYEADILSRAINCKVDIVSMHRPGKGLLEANLSIPGMINSYSNLFFKEFKYLSDSRRRWREPVDDIVESQEYDKLHILTHPFWYNDTDKSLLESISAFINYANYERYNTMADNITDLPDIMGKEEVLYG